MKKSKFIAAAALFMLASCTVSDEVFTGAENLTQQQQDENVISFGTYVGKNGATRAGAQGNMNTDKLKQTSFGVFAYHTPVSSDKYTYWNTATSATDATLLSSNYASAITANFMFNQKVEWNTTAADYVTGDGTKGWYYTPVKYWPNDFNNTDVDDQENDKNNNPAYGSGNNGNVSFFAYAPYVDFSNANNVTGINYNTADPHGDAFGIVAINGKTSLTEANSQTSDPILTYKLSRKYPVDLLWGTKGNTSTNVNGEEPTSYYTKQETADVPSIYPVNVNLTKQRTNGVVDFHFKHALASLGGGSGVSSGIGFQVMLDVDDFKGAESGGDREIFDTSGGSTPNAWRTIVTIKSIEVSNDLNDDGSIADPELALRTEGELNLATGEWGASGTDGLVEQLIGDPSITSPAYDAQLNTKIAEYYDGSTTWLSHLGSSDVKDYFKYKDGSSNKVTEDADGTHPGVMKTPINVYNDETQNPIFFIPGQKPVLRVTVDYIVRTYDENLKDKYSEVEQVISKKITFPTAFEMNKHYNLIMHLGLTGVKFTASVDNWDEGYIADNDGDLTLESSDIYLPRNVGGLMLTFSTAATNAASTATSGDLAVVSAAKYYIDGTEQTVSDLSGMTLTASPTASWLTLTDHTKATVNTANTTFTDRTANLTWKYNEITSPVYTVTQYGRIATLLHLSTDYSTPISSWADATINIGTQTVTADGYEADESGEATSTSVSAQSVANTEYSLTAEGIMLIDNATGYIADWVVVDGVSFKATSANTTGSARMATIYLKVNNKWVKTDKTISQSAS